MSSILTVSQLNKYVAFKLKSDVKLKGICVKGEISNFGVNYKSGHAYFTVKDQQSCVKAVMFANCMGRLKFEPEDGMSVVVTGNVELYEAGGTYQIIATDITPLGSGLLHMQIELVKEKLIKQGVFDEAAKKPIPLFPRKIAVVSSLTGAALQDILNILQRRFPICTVGLFHTQVQGEQAADNICESLKLADSGEFDTIILARGGGTLEDLMPFNAEKVAVAVYECKTPIITAVGHETDTTLVDYASDLRAPTPSAAAELATPDRAELFGAVESLKNSMTNALSAKIERQSNAIDKCLSELKLHSPSNKLEKDYQLVGELEKRLLTGMNSTLNRKEFDLEKSAGTLNALSPFNVLTRGYSIVRKGDSVVSSAAEISDGDRITIRFRNDELSAVVTDITRKEDINEL
ncbi:MAG: exodeoxyribonuclease VII large subunit [Ruminococcus sp.]|nr:exodeoxyribonuclease VII large subunit [Ruminococcus sp.]